MLITKVEAFGNKKRKVYLDETYAFPLYLSEIRQFHIEEGSELAEDIYEEISHTIVSRIMSRICYLITDYDRPKAQIRHKMILAGYSQEHVDMAISKLEDMGYVDDLRYAEEYVRCMAENRSKSTRQIENKLLEKGIPRDIIKQVMDNAEFDEEGQLDKALRSRGYTTETLHEATPEDKRKICGYLMRKGFSYDTFSDYLT